MTSTQDSISSKRKGAQSPYTDTLLYLLLHNSTVDFITIMSNIVMISHGMSSSYFTGGVELLARGLQNIITHTHTQ